MSHKPTFPKETNSRELTVSILMNRYQYTLDDVAIIHDTDNREFPFLLSVIHKHHVLFIKNTTTAEDAMLTFHKMFGNRVSLSVYPEWAPFFTVEELSKAHE